MKAIITTIACCLITAAATAQENHYKTAGEIYINKDITLKCSSSDITIILDYKSDPPYDSMYPDEESEYLNWKQMSDNNYMYQDWKHIDSVMMVIFLEAFTDEQIRGFYANKLKMRTLFAFSLFYDCDGNVVKCHMVFDNTLNYTSVPPAVYANFLGAFREKFKQNVPDKKYPYYSATYGFMVPNLSIIPKSTKK